MAAYSKEAVSPRASSRTDAAARKPPIAPNSEAVARRILTNATSCPLKRFDSADYFLEQRKLKEVDEARVCDDQVDAARVCDDQVDAAVAAARKASPEMDADGNYLLEMPPSIPSISRLKRVDSTDLFLSQQPRRRFHASGHASALCEDSLVDMAAIEQPAIVLLSRSRDWDATAAAR